VTYLAELEAELSAAGVRGRAARRVLDEAADHLGELERPADFGDPRLVARQVAAVVASSRTHRAAIASFAALVLTGLASIGLFALASGRSSPDIASAQTVWVGIAAALGIVFLPQLSFVAGMLMIWRALRLQQPAPAAELALVRRRAAVALGAAAATLSAWGVYAFEYRAELPGVWLEVTILAVAAVVLAPLACGAALLRVAAAPAPLPGGPAGDVFTDLEPVFSRTPLARLNLEQHPWRFAGGFALAVGVVATLATLGEGGLVAGLVRGVPEAIAVLVFYAAFGRVLGLRR
jgi:hypothetical protein